MVIATIWLRTNGVNTNGASAELIIGEKGKPGTLGEIKSRLTGVPKNSLCQKHAICSGYISADPIYPFPSPGLRCREQGRVA